MIVGSTSNSQLSLGKKTPLTETPLPRNLINGEDSDDGFCSGDLDEKAPVQTSYKGITKDQRSSTVNVNESALKKSPNAKQQGKGNYIVKQTEIDLQRDTSGLSLAKSTSPKFQNGVINKFNKIQDPAVKQLSNPKTTITTHQVNISKIQNGSQSTRNYNTRSQGSEIVKKKLEFTPKQQKEGLLFGANSKKIDVRQGLDRASELDDKNKLQQKQGLSKSKNLSSSNVIPSESKIMKRIRAKQSTNDFANGEKSISYQGSSHVNKTQNKCSNNSDTGDFQTLNRSASREISHTRVGSGTTFNRLYEDEKRRKQIRDQMQQQKEERDSKLSGECTFKPQLIKKKGKSKKSNKVRGVDEFFQEQLQYKETIEQKNFQRQMLQAQEELDYMKNQAVRASKNSTKIVNRLKSQGRDQTPEVHERLFQNQSVRQEKSVDKGEWTGSFQQQANKRLLRPSQEQELVERLHTEVNSKEEKLEQLTRKWDSQIMNMNSSPSQRDFNNRVIFEKLKNDFDLYFKKDNYFGSLTCASDQNDTSFSSNVTKGFNISIIGTSPKRDPNLMNIIKKGTQIKLKTYLKMMHELGFIHLKKSSTSEEELLTTLWKILDGTNDNSIKAENMLIVLAAVMNVTVPEVLSPHLGDINDVQGHLQRGLLCYDHFDNVHFTSSENILKMHSKFFALANNRKNRPRARSNSNTKNLTFNPQIDEYSKSIVETKFKDRYKNQQQSHLMNSKSKLSGISINDDLQMLHSLSNLRGTKKKQHSHYTQPPNKNDFSFDKNPSHIDQNTSANKRTVPLSNAYGTQSKTQKSNSQVPIEYTETQVRTRNTNINNNSSVNKSKKDMIKEANQKYSKLINDQTDQDKQRNLSDVDNNQNEDFFDQSSQISSNLAGQKAPILFIDVNLGKELGMQRLVLYEDDDPKDVAERFAVKHDLSLHKQEKLAKLLGQKLIESKKNKDL